jgi:excisionase family DNA binding protein
MPYLTLLTAEEAAAVLKCSVWTVGRLRRKCGLPAVNVGGVYKYDPDDLDAFIDANRH